MNRDPNMSFATDTLSDPVVRELRSYLYNLPKRFGYKHDRILQMRRELRVVLASAITKGHTSILFGSEPVAKRVFLPPAQWNADYKTNSHSHHGRPCARKLERGEPTHRCLTCGVDDTCVLCTYCYNPADHVGHNVFVKISSRDDGGICDCGDCEAWNRDIHCFADKGPEETYPLPPDFVSHASKVLDTMLDFSVDVLSMSSMATQSSRSQSHLMELGRASALIPSSYGIDKDAEMAAEANDRPDEDAGVEDEEDEEDARNQKDKWCLMVWDDDRRSISDLYTTLKLATSRGEEYLQLILNHVQSCGRATVAVSTNIEDLIAIRNRIRNFNTSIRLLCDVLREEMVTEIMKLAVDLCHCPVDGYEPTALMNLVGESLLRPWNIGVQPWTSRLSSIESVEHNTDVYSVSNLEYYRIPHARHEIEVIQRNFPPADFESDNGDDEELFGPKNFMGIFAMSLGSTLRDAIPHRRFNWPLEDSSARVKYLIFFDIRLHKQLRQKLSDLYIAALVSNMDLKMQVAIIYADIYPLLVDQYSKLDKDPELSVTTSLSTQLFTTPSIATKLMESDAFGVYMNMICNQYMKNGHLNPAAFKNRRLGQIFHEFRNLLWRNNVKKLVGANPARIIQTAYFLSMFQGLAPLVREEEQHVEYENERWIFCFAIMPFVIQLSRGVAIGIDQGFADNMPDAATGIQTITQALMTWQRNIYEWVRNNSNTRSTKKNRLRPIRLFNSADLDEQDSSTLQWPTSVVCVNRDPVSMLNPVHWFLSLLIQFSQINDRGKLLDVLGVTDITDISLFDANMSTMALLSQISVGWWVRNGYSLRIQLQCYRDSTLRDLAYSQDIFMTQVALSIMDPNTIFLNLARHFTVLDYPSLCLSDDDRRAIYTMDEFIHCLTFLLCDRLRFQGFTTAELMRELLRKEIIHVLGFEMMQYSELIKMVPENMAIDEHFDTVLSETANFTPPTGEQGAGKYSLKPELHSEFDPYYTHFTSARSEEAIKAADAKLGPNHLPPLLPLTGTWTRLKKFCHSVTFGSCIIPALKYMVKSEHPPVSTIDRILHLLLMIAKDDAENYDRDMKEFNANLRAQGLSGAHGAYGAGGSEGTPRIYDTKEHCFRSLGSLARFYECYDTKKDLVNLQDVLHKIADRDETRCLVPRVKQLADLMRQVEPEISEFEPSTATNTEDINDLKAHQKEKAKKMQEKVMADFVRQQQEFMNRHKGECTAEEENAEADAQDDDVDNEDTTEGYTFPKQCVFCRMLDNDGSVFGILTYTSKSDMLRNLPLGDAYWIKQAFSEDPSLDIPHPHSTPLPDLGLNHYECEVDCEAEHQPCVAWGHAFPKRDIRETTLVQGCGHGVHYKCYKEFLRNHQHQRLASQLGAAASNSDNEFLCPLCRGLNNCFLPVLWSKNEVDACDFLREPADPFADMVTASADIKPSETQNIPKIIDSAFKFLNPKYAEALQQHSMNNQFHIHVREVLQQQLLRIKRDSPVNQVENFGLRSIYRALACSVVHIDVSHRGQGHLGPFGGIVLDQLPAQTVQFLRVFGMYILTLTGFMVSMYVQAGKEFDNPDENLMIVPNQSFTRVVEMIFMGAHLRGITQKTVIRQMLVLEFGRVLILARKMNTSKLPQDISEIADPEVARAISMWTEQDPRLIYAITRYHMTVTTRRLALTIFSLCGKYDPDDYAGMMHLPEHDRLLAYLQMPDLNTIIKNIANPKTPEGYAQAMFMQQSKTSLPDFRYEFIDYPGLYRLIKLPRRLDSMFNVKGQKLPPEPAVCLLCGHMCSIQDSGFQEQGPCNTHMATCGVTQGIFLLPRRNVILLLIPLGRGTFIPAPYLDLHGEPDENMRRGRPHYLQPIRYDALMRDIWLRNGLPSLVMRRLDQSQDTGGWETL